MKKKRKLGLTVGDAVHFHSGNYEGLDGEITKIDWNSTEKGAMYGYYHEVKLSNGKTGHIEKFEHWDYKAKGKNYEKTRQSKYFSRK
jgi:hypothetical protein